MLLDIFDPKAPPQAVGIDLGTTQSVVAYVRDGQPTALISCDGTPMLPSVVHYGEHGEVIVGRAAKSYIEREPERTIASVKRFMGRGKQDAQLEQLGTYRFAEGADKNSDSGSDSEGIRFQVGEQQKTPVEVSADILRSLRQSAADQLRAVGGVVITVPAYFDDGQRQATKDAATLAGLTVLRLLNEPTAAAVAYGLQEKTSGTYAVYDLGGGTFDITLLLLDDGVFQVKSTGGDSALGGDDMDREIATRMLQAMGFDDPKAAPNSVIGLVLEAARTAKHGLTDNEIVSLELPKRGGGEIEYTLHRDQFNTWIAPLLERTAKACKRALRDAELQTTSLDGVILVGGSTRVPQVQRFVEEFFGSTPLCSLNPELVVAYGAALQASELSSDDNQTLLLDVLPLSLGVETMGGAIDKILPRNTTIPVAAKASFTTYADNQTGFELHIVQGERELAADCRSLARFTLRGIPPLPAGQARLEVSLDVDENSLLTVCARELTTGIEQQVEVTPSYGLTDEQVETMLEDALDNGEDDMERRRLAESRVEAARMMSATSKALKVDAGLLQGSERQKIEACLRELERYLGSGSSASRVQGLTQALDDATHNWAGRRMDQAFQSALAGSSVGELADKVEHARGVESHLEEHSKGSNS